MTGPGISRIGRKHTLPAGRPLLAPMAPPLNVRCWVVDIPEQPPTKNAATMITVASCLIFLLPLAEISERAW